MANLVVAFVLRHPLPCAALVLSCNCSCAWRVVDWTVGCLACCCVVEGVFRVLGAVAMLVLPRQGTFLLVNSHMRVGRVLWNADCCGMWSRVPCNVLHAMFLRGCFYADVSMPVLPCERPYSSVPTRFNAAAAQPAFRMYVEALLEYLEGFLKRT